MTGDTATTRRLVRAHHGAVAVPGAASPYDVAHYRVFHPARFTGAETERQTGRLPADDTAAPWPVLILLGGINVNPDGYRWLAEHLAGAGVATVLVHHVGEVTPGDVGLSPGLDIAALTPAEWRRRPSATVVGPLLDALAAAQADGPLAGLLDLHRVVLAGHSAGATVALLNADPAWFPGVVATVAYAGHTMPAALLGHPHGTVLPVPGNVPALVVGGGADSVIAASAVRYDAGAGHDPVTATYERATMAPGSTLAVLRTATHLTLCDPVDTTTARGFLEDPDADGAAHRAWLAELIAEFVLDPTGPAIDRFASSDLLADWRRR